MDLRAKNILITGGAVRVGRAISIALMQSGAHVYCHYNRSHADAMSLLQQSQKYTGKLFLLQSDLNSVSAAERLVEQMLEMAGRIDGLINNAAIFFKTPLGQVTENDWEQLFLLNLKIPFFCAQKAGISMKNNGGGKIINIGDPSGLNPWPLYIPYGLTKSGIIAMTKGLAKSLAPEVQVNCINPGPVMFPDHYTEEDIDRALRKTLLKREGSPQDIAHTVRFIMESGDYITGTMINVDGGRSIA
jgi:NAD(P)-dependent dehydrogenase (short-subunit alcohol dehydrogenase family)